MERKTGLMVVMVVCLALFMVACSEQDADEQDGANANEAVDDNAEADGASEDSSVESDQEPWAYDGDPVTVKMLINVGEDEFNRRYKEQIEAEFPSIELELLSGSPSDTNFLQELFATGEIPDIITVNPTRELVEDLDILMPIDDYIEESNFDLSIFREGVVDNLRSRDPLGEENLYGLPVESTLMVMYYNKEIFDLFGETYPEDGMTWDETLDLAQRLTLERDGIQYRGLVLDPSYAMPYTQLSIPGTDPETGDVLFAADPKTKQVFDWLDRYRSIPGMVNPEPENSDGFHSDDQNIAMRISTAPWLPLLAPVEGFDFDMVTAPVWEELPTTAPTSVAISFNVTKHSEHPDAAWSVVSYLASEEGQVVLSRAGSAPTIDSDDAYDQFSAMDVEQYGKEYHVRAPFIHQAAIMAPYAPYDPEITFHSDDYMTQKTREFLTSDQDVVTYLREMEEEYAAIVAEMKARN